jgi:hypothetical protein
LAAGVGTLKGAVTPVTVNVTEVLEPLIALVVNVHRPAVFVTHDTVLLQPPLQAAESVAPVIGRSSAPCTSVVTVAFHHGIQALPPISVLVATIAEWIAALTSTEAVAVAAAPSSSAIVNVTAYVPGDGNRNDGDGEVAAPALPKVHAQDATRPSLSVLRSTKLHVRSVHVELNAAAGATFGGGAATVTVAASVSESPLASVTASVTV